jgi:hypothetical protein
MFGDLQFDHIFVLNFERFGIFLDYTQAVCFVIQVDFPKCCEENSGVKWLTFFKINISIQRKFTCMWIWSNALYIEYYTLTLLIFKMAYFLSWPVQELLKKASVRCAIANSKIFAKTFNIFIRDRYLYQWYHYNHNAKRYENVIRGIINYTSLLRSLFAGPRETSDPRTGCVGDNNYTYLKLFYLGVDKRRTDGGRPSIL